MVQTMISFKQFLSESEKFDLEKFKKDCADYLGMLKGTHGKNLLYRGSQDTPSDFKIETWKEREGPRDSSFTMHDGINKYLEDKFGVPARDWMFCTGRANDAAMYSQSRKDATVIFPIGEFEWLAALDDDARDMTGFYNRCGGKKDPTYDNPEIEKGNKLAVELMKHKMEKWHWRDSEDIVGCIKSNNEIMFRCDKFYAFNYLGPTVKSHEFQDFLLSI
jgi:hypothetical protein